MSKPNELSAEVHDEISALCATGDVLAGEQKYKDAVASYNTAWKLIPEPKANWNASTWVLAANGDACFLGGYRTSARDALEFAMHCPGGFGNPFLHLRLGQVLYDNGELDRAADKLGRAYMSAGREIFAEQDGSYLNFLETRMAI